jgi:hypothetical protein
MRRSLPPQWWIDAGLLLLLSLFAIAVTVAYISQEHNFHWWIDWHQRTIGLADLVRRSPLAAWQQLQASLAWERNQLFTLPLLPFVWLSQSRLAYEIGLTLVYLVPFSLAMGAIATCLIPTQPRTVFWSTAWLTLLIPVNWIPTFLGIPDTGGALLMALATWVYLQDPGLKQRWRIPLIGGLLAIAILLRRHFTYGVLAFLGALILQTLGEFSFQLTKNPREAGRNLIGWLGRVGLITLTVGAVLAGVAWQFTYTAITRNYSSLYASWSLPLGDMVERYIYFYGWGTWAIVLIGFAIGLHTRVLSPTAARFIGLSGVLALLGWVVKLRYGNVFYALHVTPLVIAGLVAFLWTIRLTLSLNIRRFISIAVGCYLVSNFLLGLMPLQFSHPEQFGFALNMPPLVRTDYNEVVRLVNYLRQLTPGKTVSAPIYVVGSQRLELNSGLLRAAEQTLYKPEERLLQVLAVPQFDSQDYYPLQPLMQAKYVVLPDRLHFYSGKVTQYPVAGEWVLPQEQDVAKVVFTAFTERWEIAQDFTPLPQQFSLQHGLKVKVYERSRLTSIATAIRTLQQMQQQIGTRPGGQLDWLSLSSDSFQTAIVQNLDHTYQLVVFADPLLSAVKPQLGEQASSVPNPVSFLYIGARSSRSQIEGTLTLFDGACSQVSLKLSTFDQTGKMVDSVRLADTATSSVKFAHPLSISANDFLLLNVVRSNQSRDGASYCTADLNNVSVHP